MAEGRGERTIGSGHLVALFLGIVVLCCVFFILGYEMGRAQFEHGGAASAAKPGASAPAAAKPETPASGWPSSGSSAAPEGAKPVAPAASTLPAAGKPAATSQPAPARAGSAASLKAPEIPHGAIVLQVSANNNEADALALAKVLQEKGFPAFVLTPSTDQWYRVQVGPYADAKSAEQAKAALGKLGFKAFKR
jgi:cell division septation protein DedD